MKDREESIERSAMGAGSMPEGLTAPERCYYWGLKLLYTMYRRGEITREVGSEMKKGLYKEYCSFALDYRLSLWWADCFKKTEAAATRYRKNRTLENADKLLETIDKIEVNY